MDPRLCDGIAHSPRTKNLAVSYGHYYPIPLMAVPQNGFTKQDEALYVERQS